MRIIDESKMSRNTFNILKIHDLLLTKDFQETINEVYGIENNNPFESSINASSVSVYLCQAINEVMGRGCAVASPVYNIENIVIDFNKERYNITELKIVNIEHLYDESLNINLTPSNIYHELVRVIKEKYSFVN